MIFFFFSEASLFLFEYFQCCKSLFEAVTFQVNSYFKPEGEPLQIRHLV